MELLLKQKVLNFITFYVLTNLVYHITIMVEIKKNAEKGINENTVYYNNIINFFMSMKQNIYNDKT